jgi:hypothetical protein
LAYAAYKWRVQAKVGGVWKPYSTYKYFTVKKPLTGFNSTFNGSKTGWSNVTGNWYINNSMYLRSPGLSLTGSSAVHTNNYANFTYTVKVKRTGANISSANRIIIRGNPTSLDPSNWWKPSYVFQYTNNGSFSVYAMSSGGVTTTMAGWTAHSAIVQNGWNTLKVVVNGSSLKYYINNTLVWSGSNSSLTTGKVGFGFYDTDTLDVDWATLSMAPSDENLSDEVVPGMEISGGTIDQSP